MPIETPFYDPTRGMGTIIDLMTRGGDIAARRAEQTGQTWGNAAANIGQLGGEYFQQRHVEQKQKQRELAVNQIMQSWDGQDPATLVKGLLPIIGPEPAVKVAGGFSSLMAAHKKAEADPKDLASIVGGVAALEQSSPGYMQRHWQTLAPALGPVAQKFGMQIGSEYQPEYAKSVMALNDQFNPDRAPKTRQVEITNPDGSKSIQIVEDKPGQTFSSAAERPKIGTFERTVLDQFGPNATPAQVKDARQGWAEAGRVTVNVPSGKEEDAQTLANDLRAGNVTPATLSKRGDYNHVLALASRDATKEGKTFNANKAQLDYEASKRFIGSMNGNQMVRFKGLAGSVVNTIDEVKRLAEELKQGGVQKWNQAKRDTLLQVYGNTPQSEAAARYLTAVNTLKEEFANLAQGGFAPTESAWKLAEQQINGNYGVKDFISSVNEAQRLINYRIGAFDELSPTLLGGRGASSPGGTAPAPPPTLPPESQSLIDRLFGKKK